MTRSFARWSWLPDDVIDDIARAADRYVGNDRTCPSWIDRETVSCALDDSSDVRWYVATRMAARLIGVIE